MKISSPYELNIALDNDLAARKRELTTIHQSLLSETSPHILKMLRRSAILLLYAHWEGFIKRAAVYYLELVDRQRLPWNALQTSFVALVCRKTFRDIVAANSPNSFIQAVEFLIYNADHASSIPTEIDTQSNLSSRVLRDIFVSVGIQYPPDFALKEPILDEKLLANRNRISHGELQPVTEELYEEIHNFVIEGLSYFKDVLENAATTKAYLR